MWIAIPFLPPPPLSSVFPKTSQRAPEPEPSVCQGPPWSLTEPVMFGPNITGNIQRSLDGLFGWWNGSSSGAFSLETKSDSFTDGDTMQNLVNVITFSAARSSSIYGNGNFPTVQPASVRFLPCIKT